MNYFLIFIVLTASCTTSSSKFSKKHDYAHDLLRRGLYREAIAAFEENLHSDEKHSLDYEGLGLALFKAGEYSKAIHSLEKSFPSGRSRYRVQFLLGECYRVLKNYPKSLYFLRRSLKIQKNNPEALRSLAWVHWKMQNYPIALRLAEHAHRLKPEDEASSIVLIKSYIRLHRLKEAMRELKSRRWSLKHKASVWAMMGDIFYGLQHIEKAEIAYKKSLSMDPMLPSALQGLVFSLEKRGEVLEAQTYFKILERMQLESSHGYPSSKLKEANLHVGEI